MRALFPLLVITLPPIAGCDRNPAADDDWIDEALVAPAAGYPLSVYPTTITARAHVGTIGAPFVFDFTAPATMCGGGVPSSPWVWTYDRAIAQLELPQGLGGTDEAHGVSTGVDNFDDPRFCVVGRQGCPWALADGLWRAYQLAPGGAVRREVQLGYAMADKLAAAGPYLPVIGAFVPSGVCIPAGDHLRFVYRGNLPGRATDWTDAPFTAHFRHRSFGLGGPTAWTTLDDAAVQPLDITADTTRFVRAYAPLDVAVGETFTLAIVATDRYGNPTPTDATASLSGDVTGDVPFAGGWRVELPARYDTPGAKRVIPSLGGARSVWHWTVAHTGEPPVRRVLGDIHSHTGDGGAQRKFIGTFAAGDHRALYTRTWDALRYMREVAGLDFGAVSEHAVRWDGWTPPPGVDTDPAFQPNGACVGTPDLPTLPIAGWWSRQQLIVDWYQATVEGRFVAFPAYEWHAQHTTTADKSMLHRVVLFRDFAAAPYVQPLPILPGDISDISPQCIVRFLDRAGFRDRALVVPHMMLADDLNIDWDLTYDFSSTPPVATREQVDAFHRVGELYSARAIDQARDAGRPTLTVFEGSDSPAAPEPWTYRHGWQAIGARVGVIGSSDSHQQLVGVNDDFDLDGGRYQTNEPGGYAVALAATPDRAGIYDALARRASYATSGVRAWLDVTIAGAAMGTELTSSAPSAPARITLLAGMPISSVELWATPVGASGGYQRIALPPPAGETYSVALAIDNPVEPGGAPQAWLYYVRAFLDAPGGGSTEDEAVWSSPIWITWQGG